MSRITVEFLDYWTDNGCSTDDRDFWVRVLIDGAPVYRDLDPDCCGLCEPLPAGLPSDLRVSRSIPSRHDLVPIAITMWENDGGEESDGPCCGDDLEDIDPAADEESVNINVDLLTGAISNELSSGTDDCTQGCTVSTPLSMSEGLSFRVTVENECIGHALPVLDGNDGERNPHDTARCNDGLDNDCDGLIDEDGLDARFFEYFGGRDLCNALDDDCDGQIDEDFEPGYDDEDGIPGSVTCSFCTEQTQCVEGVVVGECPTRCLPASSWQTNWTNYLFARDIDVAAGRLCLVSALEAQASLFGGVHGSILCTREADDGLEASYELIPTPSEFVTGGGKVSLDPLGRVWAATATGVYAQTRLFEFPSVPDLELVASRPPACGGGFISQIEMVGLQDRLYFGPTSRPFVVCGGTLFELIPNEALGPGQQQWLSTGVAIPARTAPQGGTLFSMGASPSDAFNLFYAAPGSFPRAEYFRLGTPDPLAPLHDLASIAGGIFVVGPAFGDPLAASPRHIGYWDGASAVPLADLGSPLEVVGGGRGKYETLIAITTDPVLPGVPFKIVEGGGLGIGGPSPPNMTDEFWIVNNTFRTYSYNVGALGANTPLQMAEDDHLAPNLQVPSVGSALPTAVCRDVQLPAGPGGAAELTDPALVDGGSFDPDGDPVDLSLSTPGLFPVGSTPVTLTVADSLSFSQCSANVLVYLPQFDNLLQLLPLAWYEASPDSVVQSGGAVSAWRDSSGNGHDLVQTSPGRQPHYSTSGWNGSAPAITFDGVDDLLEYTTSDARLLSELAGEDQPFSVLLTWEPLDLDADYDLMQWDNGGADGNNSLIELRTNTSGPDEAKFRHRRGDGVHSILNTGTVKFFPAARTTAFVFDGRTLSIYDQGTTHLDVSPNDQGPLTLVRFRLAGGDNTPLNGRLAEVVIMNWTISRDHYDQYRAYAAQQWGGLGAP